MKPVYVEAVIKLPPPWYPLLETAAHGDFFLRLANCLLYALQTMTVNVQVGAAATLSEYMANLVHTFSGHVVYSLFWVSMQDLHKFGPVSTLSCVGEWLMRPHFSLCAYGQLIVSKWEYVIVFSGLVTDLMPVLLNNPSSDTVQTQFRLRESILF